METLLVLSPAEQMLRKYAIRAIRNREYISAATAKHLLAAIDRLSAPPALDNWEQRVIAHVREGRPVHPSTAEGLVCIIDRLMGGSDFLKEVEAMYEDMEANIAVLDAKYPQEEPD